MNRRNSGSNDEEAERAYRAGNQALENREDVSIRSAITWFKKTVDFNPSYALGWVRLADAHIISAIHCVDAPWIAFQKARAAAEEAAKIDRSLVDSLVSKAMVKLCFDRDPNAAEEMFLRALKANSNLPYAHNGIALLQLATGRVSEGIASLEQALRHNPISVPLYAILCHMLCFARKYEEAIDTGRRAVQADSDSAIAHSCLGSALLCLRRYDEALTCFDRARNLSHESKLYLGFWAHSCAFAGKRDEAELALAKLQSLPRHEYVPSYLVALVHLGLGNLDRAISWLKRACDERSHWVIFLNVDPMFDSIREHPEFDLILKEVGFGNS